MNTRVGISYCGYVPAFVERHPDSIDYIEIPFEMLRHDPSTASRFLEKPVILHCASMSMAGFVAPGAETLKQIEYWLKATQSPWLGEHLSFISAERPSIPADEYAPGEPYNIGYTVAPQNSEETVDRVLLSLAVCEQSFEVPILLENPPIYFVVPGGTMSQAELFSEICRRSSVGLLLDLAHLVITCRTLGQDPFAILNSLPLDRVREVHISGVDEEGEMNWDNHAAKAPDIVFDLLEYLVTRSSVEAVTLEYNWSSVFPEAVLLSEIGRVRSNLQRGREVLDVGANRK
jgi:uncharacterized protein (UPF0276 family)